MTGIVRMSPASNGGWNITLPDDNTNLNTSASTTQGLWEALNYAITNGYNFECEGAPANSANRGVITCNSSLVLPPLNDMKITIDADISFTPAVIGDGIFIDSLQNSRVAVNGYVNYGGNAYAVHFKPLNNVYSGALGIDESDITFGDIIIYQVAGHTPQGNVCMDVNSSNSVIAANRFCFRQLIAEGATQNSLAPYNFVVSGVATSGNVFRLNNINLGVMLGASTACVYISNFPYSGDNVYKITSMNPISLNPSSPTAVGLYTNNSNDTFYLGSAFAGEGAYAYGVEFGPQASQNIVLGGRAYAPGTAQFLDNNPSGGNKWLGQVVSYNAGGASGGGVTSINGITGAVSLTSGGGTINISPTGNTINLDTTGSGSGNGVITKLDTQIASNSVSLNFSTGINNSNVFYTLRINDLTVQTSGAGLYLRIGNTSIGFISSASYAYTSQYDTGSGLLENTSGGATQIALIPPGSSIGILNAAAAYINGTIEFTNPVNSPGGQMIKWDLTYYSAGGHVSTSKGTGDYIGSGISMNECQLFASTGDLMSGSVELFGMN